MLSQKQREVMENAIERDGKVGNSSIKWRIRKKTSRTIEDLNFVFGNDNRISGAKTLADQLETDDLFDLIWNIYDKCLVDDHYIDTKEGKFHRGEMQQITIMLFVAAFRESEISDYPNGHKCLPPGYLDMWDDVVDIVEEHSELERPQ